MRLRSMLELYGGGASAGSTAAAMYWLPHWQSASLGPRGRRMSGHGAGRSTILQGQMMISASLKTKHYDAPRYVNTKRLSEA